MIFHSFNYCRRYIAVIYLAAAATVLSSRRIFGLFVCLAPDLISAQGKTITGPGFTGYILNMTSQQWLTYNDVSRSIWWHYLVVVVPDEIKHPTVGGVWVTGGHNTDGYPDLNSEDMELTVTLALSTKVRGTPVFRAPICGAVGCCGAVPDPQPAHRLCRRPVPPVAL